MADTAPLRSFAAIIVAAGKGVRAGQPVPKQFAKWRGKPVLRHSAEAMSQAGATQIMVAIPPDGDALAQQALAGIGGVSFVAGGTTRQDSVRLALEKLARESPVNVLIHDAARPILPLAVIDRLLAALTMQDAAIPVLPVIDSLSVDQDGLMTGSADRAALRRVQTPQAFRFNAILSAHLHWEGAAIAGDDAQVFRAAGGNIRHIEGDEALKKLTVAEDFVMDVPAMRTGMGYDVHRFAAGEELWLGGVRIDHDQGLAGHSDADVALHAIVDAMLGAIAAGDIGDHFPPTDARWRGMPSSTFVKHAASLVSEAGYRVGNLDLTVICEAPKIGPHREAMRQTIASLLGVDTDRVSVKATTTEKLGFTGRKEGIAAQAVVTVVKGN